MKNIFYRFVGIYNSIGSQLNSTAFCKIYFKISLCYRDIFSCQIMCWLQMWAGYLSQLSGSLSQFPLSPCLSSPVLFLNFHFLHTSPGYNKKTKKVLALNWRRRKSRNRKDYIIIFLRGTMILHLFLVGNIVLLAAGRYPSMMNMHTLST